MSAQIIRVKFEDEDKPTEYIGVYANYGSAAVAATHIEIDYTANGHPCETFVESLTVQNRWI